MDMFMEIVKYIVWVLVALMALTSVWAAWENPRLFIIGALAGALFLGTVWAVLGSAVVGLVASYTQGPSPNLGADPSTFSDRLSSAWPLFSTVLFWACIVGAMIGGIGNSFIFGEFPWERKKRLAEEKKKSKKLQKKQQK